MKNIPLTIAFRMVYGKTPELSKLLKYKEKSYKFSVYRVGKIDVSKIQRNEGHSTFPVDIIREGNDEVEINAKSISIAELKELVAQYPLIGVMARHKGSNDAGDKKFVGITSMAFADINDADKVKLSTLKVAVTTKEQRDSQKNKLYSFEGKYFAAIARKDSGWKRTKTSKLREIADKVITHFKIPKDKVHLSTQASKKPTRLGLTQTFRDDANSKEPNYTVVHVHDATIDTLIHELSHLVVTYRYTRGQVESHGAEFCGVYAHILGLFGQFEEDAVIKAMTAAGLKVKKFTQSTKEVEEI